VDENAIISEMPKRRLNVTSDHAPSMDSTPTGEASRDVPRPVVEDKKPESASVRTPVHNTEENDALDHSSKLKIVTLIRAQSLEAGLITVLGINAQYHVVVEQP